MKRAGKHRERDTQQQNDAVVWNLFHEREVHVGSNLVHHLERRLQANHDKSSERNQKVAQNAAREERVHDVPHETPLKLVLGEPDPEHARNQ